MTYSIIAYDPEKELLGIAVASGSIAVGSRVPWARYLVGGVVTQAYTNPALGPLILDYLDAGLDPNEALRRALEIDPSPEDRQVAVLKWGGGSVYYSGTNIPPKYSGYSSNYCVAVANLVTRDDLAEVLCKVYEEMKYCRLAEALLESLWEAHRLGGDRRGDLSAALLIVGKTDYSPYYDKIIDLRVDYSKEPVRELKKLYRRFRKRF